jgi:hypothetical protein
MEPEPIGNGAFRIKIDELEPGEYAFILGENSSVGYTFGVGNQ